MTAITIRLVGENDDRLFKGIEVDNKIPFVDLKKRIETFTKIHPDFQELRFRGEDLHVVERPILDIRVILHCRIVFLIASNIPPHTPHETKKKQVIGASKILQRLYKDGFFATYADFAIRQIKFNREFSRFLDDVDGSIKQAVERYFTALLEKNPANPTLSFSYSEKPVQGIQAGFICKVNCGETIQRFYVKGHSAMSSRQNVDLRELFIYRLLFQIGVGPAVHIVPNLHTSSIGVYIATLEVANFNSSHVINLPLKAEIMLDLIIRLFNVSDLHGDNYGLDSNGNLSIIDFRISGYSFNSKNCDVWRSYKQQPAKLKVLEEILKDWNLQNAILETNESFNSTKELPKKRNISCMASERYSRYFESVSQNVDDCIRVCRE
ncbi:Protein CBG05181 [Caenorhabditis briggsae]|uniref:Protein CBG05181 n=2 Tax=Caenorhabditis briggsae TaxID=6238 RepID=A8WZB6_CAEBR|nr:Protein CBG05181 [Caenorhabditis briggsae]ULT99754.1 hypothetical protein L3Y34_000797 [Caenorhabditis briggsae]CAP25726.2 Protein CBG05181 [Caenorhabditis briggsae]